MRKLISLNNCLQDVLELTPIIGLITLFSILNIVLFELPSQQIVTDNIINKNI